jgi:hypothetical protein
LTALFLALLDLDQYNAMVFCETAYGETLVTSIAQSRKLQGQMARAVILFFLIALHHRIARMYKHVPLTQEPLNTANARAKVTGLMFTMMPV